MDGLVTRKRKIQKHHYNDCAVKGNSSKHEINRCEKSKCIVNISSKTSLAVFPLLFHTVLLGSISPTCRTFSLINFSTSIQQKGNSLSILSRWIYQHVYFHCDYIKILERQVLDVLFLYNEFTLYFSGCFE